MNSNEIDPLPFVSDFQEKVDAWRSWHEKWEEASSAGRGIRDFYMPRSNNAVKFLNDADELLKSQSAINQMMLEAIDDLKRRVANLEGTTIRGVLS